MATAVVWDVSMRAHSRLPRRLSQRAVCSGVSTITARGSRRSFQSSTKQTKPRVSSIAFAFEYALIPLSGNQ